MKLYKLLLNVIFSAVMLSSCADLKRDEFNNGKYTVFKAKPLKQVPDKLRYSDTSYVPIYSDIYTKTTDTRINLTATLSLRNTSFKYSIFLTDVDYYNSAGELDQHFLESPIELKPMQSIEYVIEEEDLSGGTGANFIIIWSAKTNKLKPLFEAIMISTQNRQGISFTSRGISIKN